MKKKYAHIKGWGIDADPGNDPTYPMKNYTGDDHKRLNWERPPLQEETVEVLHSNERPSLPAVFGTVVPPSGVSGAIRRFAFRYSESSYAHWLPLLFADRVNAIEGIVSDLLHGRVPNLVTERGWNAEWRLNKASLLRKIGIRVIIVSAVVMLVVLKKRKR